MRLVCVAALLASLVLHSACTSDSSRTYRGDRALGVFPMTDGSGFLVAIAELHADATEDLVVQRHAIDGSLVFHRVLATSVPTGSLGRVMMKRFTTGRLLVASASSKDMFVLSGDGETVEPITAPATVVSRMRDNTDWIVGGYDRAADVRFRITDAATVTDVLKPQGLLGSLSDVLGDIRATGDGGVASVTGSSLRRFAADGTYQWSHSTDVIAGETFGPLLQQPDASVRVLIHNATTSKIVTLDSAGQVSAEHDVGVRLPATIWVGDDGTLAAADATSARSVNADGTTRWSSSTGFGASPALFSTPEKTWIASTAAAGTHDEVSVTPIDNATGVAAAALNVTAAKL